MSDTPYKSDPSKSASTLLDLYKEAIASIANQNDTTRELSRVADAGFRGVEQRLDQITDNLRVQGDALRAQTLAIEARAAVWRDLGEGALKWLQMRWMSLLIGLACGLGISGGRELFLALVGSMTAGVPAVP